MSSGRAQNSESEGGSAVEFGGIADESAKKKHHFWSWFITIVTWRSSTGGHGSGNGGGDGGAGGFGGGGDGGDGGGLGCGGKKSLQHPVQSHASAESALQVTRPS